MKAPQYVPVQLYLTGHAVAGTSMRQLLHARSLQQVNSLSLIALHARADGGRQKL